MQRASNTISVVCLHSVHHCWFVFLHSLTFLLQCVRLDPAATASCLHANTITITFRLLRRLALSVAKELAPMIPCVQVRLLPCLAHCCFHTQASAVHCAQCRDISHLPGVTLLTAFDIITWCSSQMCRGQLCFSMHTITEPA
jgi:hypothetical protein